MIQDEIQIEDEDENLIYAHVFLQDKWPVTEFLDGDRKLLKTIGAGVLEEAVKEERNLVLNKKHELPVSTVADVIDWATRWAAEQNAQ